METLDCGKIGFMKTGKIYLQHLELLVNLEKNQLFRDDGFMASQRELYKWCSRISRSLNRKDDYTPYTKAFGTCACFNVEIDGVDGLAQIIAYVYNPHFFYEYFIPAHEETEALIRFNKLEVLDSALKKKGKNIDIFNIKDNEIISNLGGIYALENKGINLEELRTDKEVLDNDCPEKFIESLGIYFKP
jgi:hypothetical protein